MDTKAGDEHMGAFVYCTQHLRPHSTGWCSVSAEDKIPLSAQTVAEAEEECKRLGFYRYSGVNYRGRGDGAAFLLTEPLATACGQRHYRSWLAPERRARDIILRRLAALAGGA